MIARVWKGAVRPEDGDAYAAYIRDTGFNDYARTSGNLGAWMLRRDRDDKVAHYEVTDEVNVSRP